MTQTFPSGPASVIPGRPLFAFRRDPIGFLMSVVRKYGDIAHFKAASQHYFLVNDPECIKDILVTHHASSQAFGLSP